MSTDLRGTTIAFLVAPEGVEQIELRKPDDLKAYCLKAVEAFAG